MARSGKDSPGIATRVVEAARGLVSGWNAPGQPMQPIVDVAGPLAFDAPWGYNLNIAPRLGEGMTFAQLKQMGRSDLVRLAIETRKDQVGSMDWQIKPKADGKAKASDPRIADLTGFFMSPDKRAGWSTWLRAALDDLFVLDAVTVYKRRTRGGKLFSLDLLNAATISVKIDGTGRPFMYQQVSKGLPAFDFTPDELIYGMRNPRTDSVYGYGPVEQIAQTISIAGARAKRQLGHYTDGNVGDGVFWMPESWNVEQLQTLQKWWDSIHAGNQTQRRRAKFLVGSKYQPIIEPPLKDDFDEWLARVICFAFSISPQPFIKQMNRATADTAHQSALEEGLAPILKWIKDFINRIIVQDFGILDLEFDWIDDREIDPEIAEKIQDSAVRSGRLTVNEARAQKGLDPYPDGIGDTPCIITPSGVIPLPNKVMLDAQQEATLAGHQAATETARNPPADENDTPEDPKDKGGKAAKALAKKYSNPLDTPAAKAARTAIHKRVSGIFDLAAHHVAAQLRATADLGKADDPEDEKAKARKIADDLNLFDLQDVKAISNSLTAVAADSGATALDQAGVAMDTALFGQVNSKSVVWAQTHAADLVTKITDATRDMLRATIQQGFADKDLDIHGIADRIASSYGFSEQRSLLIADTETAFAHGEGALTGYRVARDLGIKIKKQWLDDPEACPICVGNALDGPIDIDEPFSSGDLTTPGHVNCSCTSVAVIED